VTRALPAAHPNHRLAVSSSLCPPPLSKAFARVDRDKQKAEVENLKAKYNVNTDEEGEKEAKKSREQ
jgi:hypothetical protein